MEAVYRYSLLTGYLSEVSLRSFDPFRAVAITWLLGLSLTWLYLASGKQDVLTPGALDHFYAKF